MSGCCAALTGELVAMRDHVVQRHLAPGERQHVADQAHGHSVGLPLANSGLRPTEVPGHGGRPARPRF